MTAAQDVLTSVEDTLFKASKNQKLAGKNLVNEYYKKLSSLKDMF